ncbi:carbohydrate ABC transporter substrate-binding protein (CUT1 family) [Halanaerobium saccharolyticum]|uniref:Carbohydrate ABC transporter substrate-binding protein (CUT1 family) n=1 Tax=Halanaerobium saccharolyticum TaxID=43595 RepID=A0A4R7Z6V7_9FIRM|nr:extracellular solute-binding protein [Halanaerobium saccharolyticum]RAK12440.1 carbohydrate ABC transporter substrate-binding protein (CUT1 family) [Halanaerobium saccharolyticum]TDW06366.1 carbohydrate ABC transporter substrate-binding protein (CUT1 family) [Halanaerobium saccharolyticum]TDX61614.1 carbohydrate ABC transporter substrate-binding protein (CUT1 family) [Halanaerobium saccharolyticum]
MKKSVLSLMIIALLLSTIPTAVLAQDEEITLRMAWWGSQNRHTRTLRVIDMYEEMNPNVNIEPQYTGWTGYWEKMAAQAAGDRLPDIMQHDRKYIVQYADNNQLVDLNPYVESGILDMSDVDMPMGEMDGKLYGITLGVNSVGIAADEVLFETAGVELPGPEWTWEEYIEIGNTIHDKLGVYADRTLPHSWGGLFDLRIWLRQHGESLYNEDATALGYEDDQLFVDLYTQMKELIDAGFYAPPSLIKEVGTNVEEELVTNQQAAMAGLWSNQIVAASSAAGKKLELLTLPKLKDQVQEGLFIKQGQYLAVTRNSEHPEEAAKFVNFFLNNIEANKVLMAERGVPAPKDVREALMPLLDEVNKEQFEYVETASNHSSAIYAPPPSGHMEIVDLKKRLMMSIMYGAIEPMEAAKEFRTTANKILAKNN